MRAKVRTKNYIPLIRSFFICLYLTCFLLAACGKSNSPLTPTSEKTSRQTFTSTNIDYVKGTHILFLSQQADQTMQVWAIDSKGSEDLTPKLILDNLPPNYWGISFLSDGFHFITKSRENIWISDLNGKPLSKVKSDELLKDLLPYSPFWMEIKRSQSQILPGHWFSPPNGEKIVIWKLGDPTMDFVDQKSGERKVLLRYDNKGYFEGNWSSNGSLFAITASRPFSNEYAKVYILSKDNTNLKLLKTYESGALGQPYWSPNGKKFVFTLEKGIQSSPYSFVVITPNTGEEKIYTVNLFEGIPEWGNNIIWSPDSKWILNLIEDRSQEARANFPNSTNTFVIVNTENGVVNFLPQKTYYGRVVAVDWK